MCELGETLLGDGLTLRSTATSVIWESGPFFQVDRINSNLAAAGAQQLAWQLVVYLGKCRSGHAHRRHNLLVLDSVAGNERELAGELRSQLAQLSLELTVVTIWVHKRNKHWQLSLEILAR